MEKQSKTLTDKIKKMYSFESRKRYNKTDFDQNLIGSCGYGETGFDSIESIVSAFKEYFTESATFYDLGSGLGKIVYHIGLLHDVKKSCGIEYSKERHEGGLELLEKYNLPESKKVILINSNILECDISDATVIYCDNTLFPVHINEKIYNMVPKGCLVISRQVFKDSIKNGEKINRHLYGIGTEYGTNSLYLFIKS